MSIHTQFPLSSGKSQKESNSQFLCYLKIFFYLQACVPFLFTSLSTSRCAKDGCAKSLYVFLNKQLCYRCVCQLSVFFFTDLPPFVFFQSAGFANKSVTVFRSLLTQPPSPLFSLRNIYFFANKQVPPLYFWGSTGTCATVECANPNFF